LELAGLGQVLRIMLGFKELAQDSVLLPRKAAAAVEQDS
jgi:hypothetical protein